MDSAVCQLKLDDGNSSGALDSEPKHLQTLYRFIYICTRLRILYNKLVIQLFSTIPLIASIALMSALWLGDDPNDMDAESLGEMKTSFARKIYRSQIRRRNYSLKARSIQTCEHKT